MKCYLVGMEGTAIGTTGLVVVGFRVGRDSLGEAAAAEVDWIGVKGEENLQGCDSSLSLRVGLKICLRDVT